MQYGCRQKRNFTPNRVDFCSTFFFPELRHTNIQYEIFLVSFSRFYFNFCY
jgi:hypothetical protein